MSAGCLPRSTAVMAKSPPAPPGTRRAACSRSLKVVFFSSIGSRHLLRLRVQNPARLTAQHTTNTQPNAGKTHGKTHKNTQAHKKTPGYQQKTQTHNKKRPASRELVRASNATAHAARGRSGI